MLLSMMPECPSRPISPARTTLVFVIVRPGVAFAAAIASEPAAADCRNVRRLREEDLFSVDVFFISGAVLYRRLRAEERRKLGRGSE